MFESTRIKLTIWYLLIIMAVSGFFSIIVYRGFLKELGRGFRYTQVAPQKRYLIEEGDGFRRILPFLIYPEEVAPEEYKEIINLAKQRFALQLIYVNGIILVLSGTAGYFLAGKTLKPIEDMLSEQKRFIADASHELRTPLTSIKTEIEVALRDKKLNLKEAKELLKSNLQETDKMKGLTDYLLTLSKYEANLFNMSMAKINLKDAVNQAIAKNLPLARSKKIKLTQNIKDVTLKGNFDSLVELFSILINNSVKYSPAESEIFIDSTVGKRRVTVKVKDNGIGIPKKDIPHIFDRFFRSDESRTKKDAEGFGLGLSIAKSIVDNHKGSIEVTSFPEKGSTFTVSLPL